MVQNYRCDNPECDFAIPSLESSGPVGLRCPLCGGELHRPDSVESGDPGMTLDGETPAPLHETLVPGKTVSLPVETLSPSSTVPASGGEILAQAPVPHRTTATRANSAETVPEQVGRFRIVARLGEGAFGIVYHAHDPQLDREVALKVAKPGALDTSEKRARFLQEARAAANLRHPNIVPLHEAGSDGDRLYLCSSLIRGRTLESRIEEAAPEGLPIPEAVRFARQLAAALAYAHAEGVVHRDVKPQNVLLDARGESHLADFGLAARRAPGTERLTQDGTALGTPSYMAPEQADGASEAASDQYSLGCALFEMLTGQTPFSGGPLQQVFLHKTQPPPRLRSFRKAAPHDLETICAKALAKAPGDRYVSCAELAEDLRRYEAGEPTLARPPGPFERLAKWTRRSPYQAATLSAILALLVSVIVVINGRWESARKDAEISLRKLEEADRQSGVVARLTDLYRKAEAATDEAESLAGTDGRRSERWAEVERDASAAVALTAGEPGLADFPLVEPARRLLERARGQLANARQRSEHRSRLPSLRAAHGEAYFFGSEYTGLEVAENARRSREAIGRGISLFEVELDRGGPPAVDPRFFSPQEARLIADRCCELLLLDAELLARPVPGEQVENLRERVRQAIGRVDRSERLFEPVAPSRCGAELRARLLEFLGEEEQARRVRDSLARIPERLAADRVLDALGHYRKEEFDKATGPLSLALRDQPDHFGAEYLLAICRLRSGRYQEAKEGLTRCLEQRPDFPWPRLLRSYASLELRQYRESEADLDAVLADPPDELAGYVARVNRGALLVRQRQWDAAEADLLRAIALRPSVPSAHLNLALARLQRFDGSAVEHAGLLLSPGPAVPLGAMEAARADARKGALAALDEGVARCPTSSRIFHERGRVRLAMADFAGAREDFRQAITQATGRGATSTLADDLIELGRLQARDGQAEDAVRSLRAALAIRPDKAVAHRLLAKPLLALGRHEEAAKALDRYLETVPVTPGKAPTPEQGSELAEVLRDRGRIQEEQARAFRGRGLMHLQARNLRSSIESYTLSLNYRRDGETLSLRGWALILCNSPELALADFEEAIGGGGADANALIGRAAARVRLGQAREAARDAEAGLRLAGDDVRHHYNAARVFALAVPERRESPRPGPATPEAAFQADCEVRAAEQLRRVLESTPAAERPTFWTEFVERDRAFDAVRSGKPMTRLASKYGKAATRLFSN
jgi:eukaryotic-like serine/threonine-protein kinase